jgi:5-hydroxyisourate hydrolase
LAVLLEREESGAWRRAGEGVTGPDGRVANLAPALTPGRYRITFATGAYHAAAGVAAFYPQVQVEFTVRDASEHYHIPLLLSPYGYSTYRGS